ncbi:MAG: glycine--tRNA ligase subunit beta [Deltaproteobacteria bacterium HGW-Deltaproteobacteria-11]|nr:MAG: glycine--tRNA ligase subunit beta [Deltaproteobacteria bacterium HGW-Deltaproteobacteria-11]
MGKELLLEIGTEEIPAAFLPTAEKDMAEIIRREFAALRIRHGKVKTMAAPRRLCLCVEEVAEKQDDQVVEKLGPAVRVAFDEQGQPTKAALGFAKGQGLVFSELQRVTTDKGEYLLVRKEIIGEETKNLLPDMLVRFIPSIPFKKSMRWSHFELRFARPIHWIVALFGGETVDFQIENIRSGNRTFGHRFMSPKFAAVRDFKDYLAVTRENFVIVDPGERKRIIREETAKAAAAVSGQALENDGLLQEVTYLTEYPSVVCGSYDETYLRLPKEVLVTSMMSHQKYFPVIDAAGKLLPFFLTVNNTLPRDPAVVARGNEKVIRARLADAKFFFEEDRKISLDRRVEDLKKVVFHTLLGTSYEKVMRFRALATAIADEIRPALKETVDRTAVLAKADLDTQMVCEFTELQGIMGREYALLAGENPVVAAAICEHYLPIAAGGALPETDEGAIVSIADKLDTIVGFFGVNLIPTGTADPYALRRQALGIINIILHKKYPLTLTEWIDKSLAILDGKLRRPAAEVRADVLEFFRARFENLLISQGHPYDVVDAVLTARAAHLVDAVQKIEAMEAFKSHEDFQPLAIAFKRVGNILKDFRGGAVDPALFEAEAEKALHEACQAIGEIAIRQIAGGDYAQALIQLARLRKPVDAFFDAVLVMAKEEKVKLNRLSLLKEISELFHRIADFSKIVTEV